MRILNVSFDFVVEGWPAERYTGSKSFGMNSSEDESFIDIEDRAYSRAKDLVARDGCWSRSVVKIKNLTIQS